MRFNMRAFLWLFVLVALISFAYTRCQRPEKIPFADGSGWIWPTSHWHQPVYFLSGFLDGVFVIRHWVVAEIAATTGAAFVAVRGIVRNVGFHYSQPVVPVGGR